MRDEENDGACFYGCTAMVVLSKILGLACCCKRCVNVVV